MKTGKFICLAMLCSIFMGCASITTQEMCYLGDETPLPNVTGSVTHFDFAGIGISPAGYAKEYNDAVNNALKQCLPNVEKLQSVKAFKSPQYWPKYLGLALCGLGAGLYASNTKDPTLGALIAAGGLIIGMINSYDFIIIAEPVYKQ